MSKQITKKSVFFWGRKWKQLCWNSLFLLLIHQLESCLLYLLSSCSPWRNFVKKREWEAWFMPFVFTVFELGKFFSCWFLVEEEISGRQDWYSLGLCVSENKMEINILINRVSERGMRAIAQRHEVAFQNYFLIWEFDFISMAQIGMAWAMCCNIGVEFFQDQASTFCKNSFPGVLWRAWWALSSCFWLLLSSCKCCGKANWEPCLVISSNIGWAGIACSCDDRGLLDHSIKPSRSYVDCSGGKARFCLPDLVDLRFWEVSKEISEVRGEILTAKPSKAKASRPQQSHWNQMRGCKELIRTISYWHTFFFLTCFISLNGIQTLSVTVMERIWAASHVCFLTSTSTSGYCNLAFLAATLCCGFFLSGQKLCSSSLCRWICVDDASLPCQLSLGWLFCPIDMPMRRVFLQCMSQHWAPSPEHVMNANALPPPQLFSIAVQCKEQCCGETKLKWLIVFVVEENKQQERCKCQNDQ